MRHSERHQPQRCSNENNAFAARAPTVKFGVGEARQQDEVITRRELVPSKVVEQGSVGYADFRYEYDRQNAVDGSHPKEHADEGINSAPPAACGDQKSEGVKAYGIEQRIGAVGRVDVSRQVSRDARGHDHEAKEDRRVLIILTFKVGDEKKNDEEHTADLEALLEHFRDASKLEDRKVDCDE